MLAPGSSDAPTSRSSGWRQSSRRGRHSPPGRRSRPAAGACSVYLRHDRTAERRGLELWRCSLTRIALNAKNIGAACRGRTLVALPTSFGHGLIGNALTPLLSGGDIVLHPLGLPLAQNLGVVIDQYRIGFMQGSVPSFWRIALQFQQHAPLGRTLARVHVGSAPLPLRICGARIVEALVARRGRELLWRHRARQLGCRRVVTGGGHCRWPGRQAVGRQGGDQRSLGRDPRHGRGRTPGEFAER